MTGPTRCRRKPETSLTNLNNREINMLKRSSLRVILGTAMASALALAAVAQDAPKMGGVLQVVVTPEPPSLLTGLVTNTPTQMVSGNILESLLRFMPELEPIPSLAESWAIDETETVYVFKIREGVTWHDGVAFTADDVLFSLNEFLMTVNPRWRTVVGSHVDSIEKTGDFEITIKLKHFFNPLLMAFENGSMPIVPKHIYEGTEYASNPMNNTPVGTGPMKFKDWVRGSHIELVKNENYYIEGLPRLDGALFRFIPDAASRAIAFETGEVDVMTGGSMESADIERLSKQDNVCVTTGGWELFAPLSYLQLNVRSGPLANKTFRQGLMYALDTEFIRDVVWGGYGEIGTGPISPRKRFFPTDSAYPYKFDPDKARELIEASGYDGEVLRLMPTPYGENWTRTAEIARQNFQDVGVNIEMIATDAAGWNQRASSGEFDITNNWTYQYGDPALGVARMWVSSTIDVGNPFSNIGGYSNSELDALWEKGAAAPSAERPAIYKQIHETLAEEVPALWSVDVNFPTVTNCNVREYISTASGANDGLLNAWINE